VSSVVIENYYAKLQLSIRVILFVALQVIPFCKVTKLENHTCTCKEQTEHNISNEENKIENFENFW